MLTNIHLIEVGLITSSRFTPRGNPGAAHIGVQSSPIPVKQSRSSSSCFLEAGNRIYGLYPSLSR